MKSAPAAPTSSSARQQIQRYFAAAPPNARKRLNEMRKLIRSVAPSAVEHFSYRIPGFRLDGQPLVWYAAFKNHTSLYPIGDAIRRDLADALEGYETSKGTVRFPLDKPLATGLVRRLVKARVAEVRRPKHAKG